MVPQTVVFEWCGVLAALGFHWYDSWTQKASWLAPLLFVVEKRRHPRSRRFDRDGCSKWKKNRSIVFRCLCALSRLPTVKTPRRRYGMPQNEKYKFHWSRGGLRSIYTWYSLRGSKNWSQTVGASLTVRGKGPCCSTLDSGNQGVPCASGHIHCTRTWLRKRVFQSEPEVWQMYVLEYAKMFMIVLFFAETQGSLGLTWASGLVRPRISGEEKNAK